MIINSFIEGQVSLIISCNQYYLHGGNKKVGEITVNLLVAVVQTQSTFFGRSVQFFHRY